MCGDTILNYTLQIVGTGVETPLQLIIGVTIMLEPIFTIDSLQFKLYNPEGGGVVPFRNSILNMIIKELTHIEARESH